MGTRSLTVFMDSFFSNSHGDKEIAVMYRQYDGYMSRHGAELAHFLTGSKIVNGYDKSDKNNFNGMPCLAASVIAHMKDGIGNIYLYPAATRNCGEEYIYFISQKNGDINIRVYDVYNNRDIFNGNPSDMLKKVKL